MRVKHLKLMIRNSIQSCKAKQQKTHWQFHLERTKAMNDPMPIWNLWETLHLWLTAVCERWNILPSNVFFLSEFPSSKTSMLSHCWGLVPPRNLILWRKESPQDARLPCVWQRVALLHSVHFVRHFDYFHGMALCISVAKTAVGYRTSQSDFWSFRLWIFPQKMLIVHQNRKTQKR